MQKGLKAYYEKNEYYQRIGYFFTGLTTLFGVNSILDKEGKVVLPSPKKIKLYIKKNFGTSDEQ